MARIFLFDVDGTLTPPRNRMREEFAEFFSEFVRTHPVFLVSGSDYKKIQEQVPQDILDNCAGVFGCAGAEYFEKDTMVYRKTHEFPAELIAMVTEFIDRSPYAHRHGTHVENRPGMLNISVVGRDATSEQRSLYHRWDQEHDERAQFTSLFNATFDGYEASCGGEISIDIVPSGWNKSVVKAEVQDKFPGAELIFFGDKMGPQGNDRPLALALDTPCRMHRAIPVEGYEETWQHLRKFSAEDGGADSGASGTSGKITLPS